MITKIALINDNDNIIFAIAKHENNKIIACSNFWLAQQVDEHICFVSRTQQMRN